MSSYRFDSYNRYPICEALADPGVGKSLFLTYNAWLAAQDGVSVFANFHLVGIPYHYVRVYTEIYEENGKRKKREYNDILDGKTEDGTPIQDGLLLFDEPQAAGMSKHNFWNKSTQDMATFVSQIRKRDLALIMATQRENFPVFDVRQLVSIMFLLYKTKTPGIIDVHKFDPQLETILSKDRYDLRQFFHNYDSKELIGVKTL